MTVSRASSLPARWLVLVVASLVLLAIAVRLAWLGDDAYITLRSVENWASGNGLRWNTTDRVQTYTHPLWMLLLTLGRVLSGEVYFTTLTISLVLSMTAVGWLLWRASTVAATVATVALLIGARTFGDYMTSGLETPLTYLLLVAFVAAVLRPVDDVDAAKRRYTRAVLLASLLATNRMDLALLCLPPVLATMRSVPLAALFGRGLLASLPFIGWLAFAGIYYGSPFPVTAHAKAFGVGIASSELIDQGLRYLMHAAGHDPVLFLTVAGGSLMLLFTPRARWLALGALLYVGYVVKVGGGFMQGRFLLPPFVVVVASVAPWLARRGWWASLPVTAWALLLLLLFGDALPGWLLPRSSDVPLSQEQIEYQHGIVDERRMYYHELGLLSATRAIPRFGGLEALAFPEGRDRRWFLLNGAVGSAGFGAGAGGHIIDPLLCDPLVARLPARDPQHWRIGHVLRRIPEGYYESLASGENRVVHPGLRRYYEALRTLTRAPVFSGERLATLWRMARGEWNDDLRAFLESDYYDPPRIEVAASTLPPELQIGVYWFDEPRVHLVYKGGVAVRFAEPMTAASLQVQTLGLCAFRFRFVQGEQVLGEATGTPLPWPSGLAPLRMVAGLRTERVIVPTAAAEFDTLWIDFVELPGSDKATGPPGFGAITIEK